LPIGNHWFRLLHIDFFQFESVHPIEINEQTKIIEIAPTIASNTAKVTNYLPDNFHRFSPMQNW
jgi:hypothetical protein